MLIIDIIKLFLKALLPENIVTQLTVENLQEQDSWSSVI